VFSFVFLCFHFDWRILHRPIGSQYFQNPVFAFPRFLLADEKHIYRPRNFYFLFFSSPSIMHDSQVEAVATTIAVKALIEKINKHGEVLANLLYCIRDLNDRLIKFEDARAPEVSQVPEDESSSSGVSVPQD